MKPFLKNLLEYSHHYNLQLIEIFADPAMAEKLSKKAKLLLSHTLNASSVWNSRILNIPNRVGIWDVFEAQEMLKLENQNFEETFEILEISNLAEIISYTNSKGDSYKRSIEDIIFHTINHATYHRGQIASEFRKCGVEPIVSDYIFYKDDNRLKI